MAIYIQKSIGVDYWLSGPIYLDQTIRKYLQPNEQLTNRKALSIFKDIKQQATIKSFLFKNIVLIPASLTLISLHLLFEPTINSRLLLIIFRITSTFIFYSPAFLMIAASPIAFRIMMPDYPSISQAYKDQAHVADTYIQKLEKAPIAAVYI